MKLLLAVILALFVPLSTYAQTADAPFENANTILIHTPDSGAVALKNIARLFLAKGFPMDKMEAELGYFATGLVQLNKAAGSVSTCRLRVVQSPTSTHDFILTGDVASYTRYGNSNKPMAFEKIINYRRIAFLMADAIIKEYPGATLTYSLR